MVVEGLTKIFSISINCKNEVQNVTEQTSSKGCKIGYLLHISFVYKSVPVTFVLRTQPLEEGFQSQPPVC